MLDSYELKQGSFEIVDSQMIELRSKRYGYYRLLRFLLLLLIVAGIILIFLTIITSQIIWLFLLLSALILAYWAIRNLKLLSSQLSPQISGILLDYDQNKILQRFRVRKWIQNKIDNYSEEDIRFNQAVGFKALWHDDGFLEVEIIVDPEFPGTKIFETYDFFVIAELYVFFEKAMPKHDTWVYLLVDGNKWPSENLKELEEEIKTARIPWNVREYFTEL